MLGTRVLTALVFVPLLLLFVAFGGVPLALLCVLLTLVMAWEYGRLALADGTPFELFLLYVATFLLALGSLGWFSPALTTALLPLVAMASLGAVLVRPQPAGDAVARAARLTFGAVYCGALLPFLAVLRDFHADGLRWSLLALLGTWLADTGAYFGGKAWGRRKLHPRVSPGKTIEGALAGVGATILVVWIVGGPLLPFSGMPLGFVDVVLLGIVISVLGVVGDLGESVLKRAAGAKDSSALMPGHGGVLDRFDAVMFVCPAVYAYLVLWA